MEPQDLSELVALYALDTLSDEERALVEAELVKAELTQASTRSAIELSALHQELTRFQTAVAAMAYSVPEVPISPNLKDRLMQRISSPSWVATRSAQVEPGVLETLKQQSETVQWEIYPSAPKTTLGMLWVNEQTRQGQCFIRATGAMQFPLHLHRQPEEIIVLEGDLEIDGQIYYRGTQIIAEADTQHQPRTQTGCLVSVRFCLDDEILEEETQVEQAGPERS